jgi:hypothetical protein
VHGLAAAEGLALHDVWEVAVALPEDVPVERWVEALRAEPRGAVSGALFGLRRALGRLLGLDGGSAGLVPVYREREEMLARITNRTVVAFAHYSLADRRPRLAVYVRPQGALGRGYLTLIDPFRRRVIYPALMAAGARAAERLGGRALS